MTCAVDHARLKRDSDAWALLPLIGTMPTYKPDGSQLELRNCACGSTLARELAEPKS